MPREHIKPRSISRQITPRNIRAIKPKRQLAWNKQHDEVDDDLWYTTVYGDSTKQGGGSSSTSRSRQSYNNIEDDDYDSEEEENDIPRSKICKLLSIFKAIYKCFICICKSTKSGYDSIRKLPPTQRRNRFLLFLILICVLRIYLKSMFMNLNQYSLFNKNETKSITPVVGGRSSSSMPLDTDDGWEESSSLFGTPKTQSKVMGAGGAVGSPLFGSSNLRGASSGLMSSGSMGSSLSSGIQQQSQTGGLNTNSLYPQQQASAGYGASGSLNTYGASGSISSSQQLQSNAIQMGMKTNLVGGSLQQQPIQQAQMPQQNQYQQQAQMPQQNQLQYNNNQLQTNTQTQYKQPVLGNQYLSSSGSQQQSLNSGIVGNSQQQGMSGNGYSGSGGSANIQNFF